MEERGRLMKTRLQSCIGVAAAVVVAQLACILWASSAHAYPTWSDGCVNCHGDFNSGTYISQRDGTSWGASLMSGHVGFMGSGTCNVCHQPTTGLPRFPVYIGISAGISGYSPISCLGCHGRADDASGSCVNGDTATINPANCGMGAGLRAHHAVAGVGGCADCHTDVTPVGENAFPTYYFTPDTAHPNKPVNPCNAAASPGNENKFGLAGLDNDGDGLYDQNDPDCQTTPEAGAACFDGIDNDGDGAIDCADSGCNGATGGTVTNCGVGACARTGNQICQGGVAVSHCTPGTPSAEVCNNTDDNCDGTVDNITPAACQTARSGVCAAGTTACSGGALVCNQNVQPTAEVCNGLDDNCDGTVDNITRAACKVPGQVGPCANGQTACQSSTTICQQTVQPVPETPAGSAICADTVDNDCDGATDLADTGCQFPAETNCFDGIDNNGDGTTDCSDPTCANAQGPVTNCGAGACAATGKRVCQNGAEVNTCVAGTPTAEVCDGIDNDCNGAVDNGIQPVAITCGTGVCRADGQKVCSGGHLVDQCTPGQPQLEVCNNLDDDCDGTIDNITPVPTTCGVGACASSGQMVCRNGASVDTCTPLPSGVEGPFSSPTCTDGIDNDCDGTTDAADTSCAQTCVPEAEVCDGIDNDCNGVVDDGIAPIAITCGVGACENTGVRVCINGVSQDQCTPLPAAEEGPAGDATCTDGIDNNCNGRTDAEDPNCAQGCVPVPEVCDGIDNDCDGIIDNGIAATPTTCGVGACASSGQMECQNGQFVDTCVPAAAGVEQLGVGTTCSDNVDNDCDSLVDSADPGCTAPPVEQACFDGLDNDGDGLVDCADPDCAGAVGGPCDTGLGGACAAGQMQCVQGNAAQCVQEVFPGPEVCTDGIDNDCDGQVDAADTDCQLVKICHVSRGDRDKIRLITIDPGAVRMHLKHGDFFPGPDGTCKRGDEDTDGHRYHDGGGRARVRMRQIIAR